VLFEATLTDREPRFLADHRLGETVILPATAQLEMALAAGRTLWQGRGVAVERLALQSPLVLSRGEPRVVQTLLTPDGAGYCLELFSRAECTDTALAPSWIRHARATVAPAEAACAATALDELRSRCTEEIGCDVVYDRIGRQGLRYGPSFRLLCRAWRRPGEALGFVTGHDDMALDTEDYWFHPAILDACLHVIAALPEANQPETLVPVAVERFEVLGRPGRRVWSHAALRAAPGGPPFPGLLADMQVLDGDGRLIARFKGLQFRALPPANGLPSALVGEVAVSPPRPAPWLQQLQQTPSGNRLRLLVSLLRAEVAAVLGWESASRVGAKQGLFDLGLDSLGSVELQARLQKALGCDLPLTLAIDYPDVQSLAGHIVRRLNLDVKQPSGIP
jgi:acyl transferase domain-containing protein